ncbi:Retrovirus-related Pol polyprotein from transposon RE1 [Vitis vinifera]|uniref:Retrovirus-related Pol polyprotein from transposon RE1 n=1 Tax=Vitis vinifera TaxID=29760 RepID=A0A438ESS4_VITVI|nr:Retrovirus-related Pol polyprotein from transposon RE1 [Vitis vinifera]
MKELETIKEYSRRLLSIANRAQEQRMVTRQEATVEEALPAKHEDGWRNKNKKNRKHQQSNGEAAAHRSNKTKLEVPRESTHLVSIVTKLATHRSSAGKGQMLSSISSDSCLIDSGCTNHMTHDKELFKELKPTKIARVRIDHGGHIPAKGIGTVAITTHLDNYCLIKDASGQDLFKVKMRGKSFSLDPLEEEQIAFPVKENIVELWHKRLGHYRYQGLFKMQKSEMVEGLPEFELIHTDVGGPQRTPSIKGWNTFWKFKAKVENESGCKILILRSDNGKEYTSCQLNLFCEEAGIEHQLSAPYTPEQNGVKRDKLDKKVAAEIFIGYSTISKAYKVFQPHTDTIIISRDVHFMENEEWDWEDSKTKLETSFLDEMEDDPLVRSTRLLSEIYQRCNVAIYEPVDHEEALKESKWKDAMKEELFMIEKKQNLGAFNKYKARLVVKGYAQFFGVDYSETFAPVARLDTIRLLLASSAQLGWKVHQMDVKSAFLNGILQEEIYVEQPKGFVMEDKVYRLHKAFYGLKQAPRAWKKSIPWRIRFTRVVPHAKDTALESKSLSSVGYSRKSYPEVTSQRLARGKLVHFHGWKSLALPSVGPGSSAKLIDEFKLDMMQVFEMTDLGLMTYFLGMEIKQGKDQVFICQIKYTKEILKNNRPDILYVVSVLSRITHYASEVHLKAVKRVVRYIKGTVDYGVKFQKIPNMKLFGYSDSDWGGSLDDMKSTSGYCFSLGSGSFSWC